MSIIFVFIGQKAMAQPNVIQVGADNAYFPFEYINDDNESAGFDIDLLKALAENQNLKIKITNGDWFLIKDGMESGDFDMLAGMYYNPDRAELFDFTVPYIIITHSIFVKQGNKIRSINEIKENKSLRVVVENSSILHKYLTTNGVLPERILAVENQLDALMLVEDSYTTCALLPDLQAKYIAHKNGLDDIKAVGLPILPREYSFAVIKGDTALLSTLNRGINRLHQSGKYKQIFEKWFGSYSPTYSILEENYSIFFLVSIALAIIMIFVYTFMQSRFKKLKSENKSLYSELKQTNQVLKDVHKNETLYKRIIEFSPFPIAMIHEDGYFVFTNSGFEELFGKQSGKTGSVNHWLRKSINKEHEQNFVKSQFFYNPKDLVSQKTTDSAFTISNRLGEELPMHLSFVSLGNGQLLIFLVEDAKMKGSNLNTSEAEHNNKPIFLPSFAHEVRSPMNIIMGFSEMMCTEDLELDEMKVYSSLIRQNGQDLHQLLQNIGTLTSIGSDELLLNTEFILVEELMKSIIQQHKLIYAKNAPPDYLKLRSEEDQQRELVVNVDREIFTQVFFNLIKYIRRIAQKDRVSIAYILTESSKVQFSIEAELQKAESEKLNELILSFDTNERKTDKFIDSAFHLGLYISLLLVKFTGNKIELKKNDNLYSLQFSLPNFSSEDPVAQYRIKPFPKMKQQYNWEGKTILIAEDNSQSLYYFELIFKATKANIITAKDGREAYEICRKDSKIDLVIMDWLMPIMDGETSTKLIKQIEPTLPIVAVTAFALGDERAKILKSGCIAYYPKPVDKDELFSYLNTLFED